jgi:phage tail sheath protein FI
VDDKTRDKNLTNAFPALRQLYGSAAKRLNRLPASAAMAGVMTFTDNARGVWTAPANIALASVDGPALTISDDEQADLNTPLDGKAINIIRELIGRGPVVWGARTLDGNSNDYRFVQVRRTLIYIEQSVKAALNSFVVAPNDGKTWVSVTAMVSNFLHDLWAKGGLMGATSKEACSVDCGLGTTMTGRDVLEGYMIVRVLVQMIHPAEFIELTFKQKMEHVG